MYLTALIGADSELELAVRRLEPHLARLLNGTAKAERVDREHAVVLSDQAVSDSMDGRVSSGMVGYCFDPTSERLRTAGSLTASPSQEDVGAGEFFALGVDTSAGTRLTALTDRAASVPGYLARGADLVVVSNDPLTPAVALGLGELDDAVALAMLRYGHSITTSTVVAGVERLPPGGMVEIAAARGTLEVSESRYVRYRWRDAGPEPPSREERCFAALQRSCGRLLDQLATSERYPQGRLFYQLSGGLDSRLTCGALAATGNAERGQAVTYDITDDFEIEIATSVAGRLGMEHQVIGLAQATRQDLTSGWLRTGGQVAVHAAAGNELGYRALGATADAPIGLIGAWPGDVLAGSYIPVLQPYASASDVATACRSWARGYGYGRRVLTRMVDPELVQAHNATAEQTVIDRLDDLPGPTSAQRISLWALSVRQPAFSFVELTSRCVETAVRSPGHA